MLSLFIRMADNPRRIIPPSLSCQFLEVFEKRIYDSIYHHLCINDIVTPHQAGFRPGESRVNQLLAITHKIYKRLLRQHPLKKPKQYFLICQMHLIEYGMKGYYISLNFAEYQVVFFPSSQVSLQIENRPYF